MTESLTKRALDAYNAQEHAKTIDLKDGLADSERRLREAMTSVLGWTPLSIQTAGLAGYAVAVDDGMRFRSVYGPLEVHFDADPPGPWSEIVSLTELGWLIQQRKTITELGWLIQQRKNDVDATMDPRLARLPPERRALRNAGCGLHTSFALLRQNACSGAYRKLAKHLGGATKYGKDTPIALSTILEISLDDALWTLRATAPEEQAERDRISRLFACDCAEAVLPIFEKERPGDKRPREAIETARLYAIGLATKDQLDDARDVAWAAAYPLAGTAAWTAAGTVAWAAAWSASRTASRVAALDAGVKWQTVRFRAYLETQEHEEKESQREG